MDILTIPGEELNQYNIYSSVFELHQATALRNHTSINCGFISVNLQGNLFAEIKKLFTFRISIKGFINFLKTKKVSFISIQDFNCVEASSFFVWSGKFKTKYQEQTTVGLRAYEAYVKQFGKPDIIHAHSRFLTGGLIAQAIKSKYGTPYVLTEHSTYYARNLLTLEDKKQIQFVINNATKWICVSPQLGNLVTTMVVGLNKTFEYVPNVVDPMFENIMPNKLTSTNEPFVFINIASLDEKKAQSILIEAFAKQFANNKKCILYIAGTGPLETELKNFVVAKGLNNQVFFLGHLNRNQISTYLQNCHAFVLSSTYETFGVVLIEALACGKPVISTACGGPENIVHEQNGYLIPTNNVEELGNAMLAMKNNYHLFNMLQIREDCIAKFGSVSFAKQMQSIYTKTSRTA